MTTQALSEALAKAALPASGYHPRSKASQSLRAAQTESSKARNTPDATPGAEAQPGQRTLQILDLHSDKPLITCDGKLYSCHWATDLGTNLYFAAAPEDDADSDYIPLRSFNTFDLLGTSRARLVAEPASLQVRSAIRDAERPRGIDTAPDATHSVTNHNDHVYSSATRGIQIETAEGASEQQVNQALFLEQWAAVRLARGDDARVPIVPIRNRDNKYPVNWQIERDQYLAARAGRLGDSPHESQPSEEAIDPGLRDDVSSTPRGSVNAKASRQPSVDPMEGRESATINTESVAQPAAQSEAQNEDAMDLDQTHDKPDTDDDNDDHNDNDNDDTIL